MKKVSSLLLCLVGVIHGHLLPHALEDVHKFVQTELQQRSQGQLGIESPPSGGPMFQSAATQTYIGVPVVLRNQFTLDGNGGIQRPINGDLNTAQSQIVLQQQQVGGDSLPRGLLPPSPLLQQQQQQQEQVAASNEQPQVIAANLVGPSTFVNNNGGQNIGNVEVAIPPEIITQGNNAAVRTAMEGWVPLGGEGSKFAKGVGVKLQVEVDKQDSQKKEPENGSELAFKDVGYSVRKPNGGDSQNKAENNNNELEILPTNSIKLQDIVIGTKNPKVRSPVYPGGSRDPKVVIHAQNVIIRGGEDLANPEINAESSTSVNSTSNVKQFPAYGGVPQLNNYLRDQLRLAALNQLMQSRHPLNEKPFPRPLSLREIARAVRNGEFPVEPVLPEPLLTQPSQLQFSVPHVVSMGPDTLSLPSIQAQTKLPFAGGLGNLYKNLVQGAGGPGPFDPREALDYSLLAALSGQKVKVPGVPTFKSKPNYTPGYGDSVAYSIGKDEGKRDPIQILPAEPIKPELNQGSLRGVSEQILKQMILQELGEIQDTPDVLLPAGLSNPARLPLRHLKPSGGRPTSYGTNAHPFAYLSEGQGGQPDAVFEETFEYTLPPGMSIDDYMNDNGPLLAVRKKPKGYPYPYQGGYESSTGEEDTAMPINGDTLMKLGKGLFNSALEFSRHHNPMTLLSRIRSLPPVKVDLYKVPMGVPDGVMSKLPEKWRKEGGSSSSRDGPPRGGRGGANRGNKRGRRKNSPRKNSSRY